MKSWKECERTGKRSYPNKQSARQAMRNANNRIRLYECEHCHGWHVTKEEFNNSRRGA